VVDCRTQREREVSRISGSITAAEFQERKEELRGKKLLMHCLVGGRALPVSGTRCRRAAGHDHMRATTDSTRWRVEAARSEGFDAATIAGSLLAWATENLPLVDDNGPTSSLLVRRRPLM